MFIRNSRVAYLVHGTAMQCQSYVSQGPYTENCFHSHQEKKRQDLSGIIVKTKMIFQRNIAKKSLPFASI